MQDAAPPRDGDADPTHGSQSVTEESSEKWSSWLSCSPRSLEENGRAYSGEMRPFVSRVLHSIGGPSCGGSCSGSCGNLRDTKSRQNQESPAKREAEYSPNTFAPGWADFQKVSRLRSRNRTLAVGANTQSVGLQKGTCAHSQRELCLIIQSYKNFLIAKDGAQIK